MDSDVAGLMEQLGWRFEERRESGVVVTELCDADYNVLAWICRRPNYCDRGHWQVGVEKFAVRDLDGQDAFPKYFMRLETAKQELVEFMAWRLHKRRAP